MLEAIFESHILLIVLVIMQQDGMEPVRWEISKIYHPRDVLLESGNIFSSAAIAYLSGQ